MSRKVYQSEKGYLLSEHAAIFSWVFEIEELAKHWMGYTPEVGKQAQAGVVAKAVECAKKIDRKNGHEVVIGKS
jgi:hypothetical protein